MRLIVFHRILITTGLLFALGFGAYQGHRFRQGDGWLALLLASGSLLAAVGLAVYLKNLGRFVRLH